MRPSEPIPSGQPSSVHVERYRRALAAADAVAERQLVAREALAAMGITPLAGGAAPLDPRWYTVQDAQGPVGGFIPGRHPILRNELVVMYAQSDDPKAAVLLETARVLVERSKTENVPGRSVLVWLALDERNDEIRMLWPPERIHARLSLMRGDADSLDYQVVWPNGGQVEVFGAGTGTIQQLELLLHHVLRLASPTDPSSVQLTPSPVQE